MDNQQELTDSQLEILEKCRVKHQSSLQSEYDDDDVYYVLRPNSFVVFRAPRKAEIQKFKGVVADDKKNATAKANADWELASSIILHPSDKAEREKLFHRKPLLLTEVAAEALAVASDVELKAAKKYVSDTM